MLEWKNRVKIWNIRDRGQKKVTHLKSQMRAFDQNKPLRAWRRMRISITSSNFLHHLEWKIQRTPLMPWPQNSQNTTFGGGFCQIRKRPPVALSNYGGQAG